MKRRPVHWKQIDVVAVEPVNDRDVGDATHPRDLVAHSKVQAGGRESGASGAARSAAPALPAP